MCPQHLYIADIYSLLPLSLLYLPAASDPIAPGWPFVILWNAPTRPCLDSHGVMIDLETFDIVSNQNQSFMGTNAVIFYNTHLGLYPFYDHNYVPVNGGLPQNASLEEHLVKVHKDLKSASVDKNFNGVAVVDWEHWRPLWNRNWKKKALYQLQSLEMISQRHPLWSYRRIQRLAKRQFEASAKDFMLSTLHLGRKLSPKGLWGFYGFPECYNFEYKNGSQNYTGQCPDDEVERNDALTWLWGISRALYPHIYLDTDLKDSEYVRLFVRHRVEEGFRVHKVSPGADLPVLPYARIVYTYSMDFLTQGDLVQTIGQSAALGATGVVLWGNADYSSSKESCLAVRSYIEKTLGPYAKNVTTGAILCSRTQCSNHGRCVRKYPEKDTHLHLDPTIFSIKQHPLGESVVVLDNTSSKKLIRMWPQFLCRCYKGWQGSDCSHKRH
ncbi:hyaluronidase-1-like [Pseudophryne corroboree]|uniref:hyaluronidase-1-like n=1 Tax=Pseudophryne corroboree TaxID=495146 RepID=UPI00308203D3